MTGLGNLGAYELLRPLGAGGMAETFVAVRRGPANFEQRVCLKRILPHCAADATFVELFLDEARLLARLNCANIVHVYDFGEVEGTYYMALELIDGVDLEGLLGSLREKGERMPESVALYIVSEVLVALSYAHTLEIDGEPQGIVHRDISPSNILLSKTGEVKLTDFGIAKARGRSHRTQTGTTKGKVAYMSPEQVRAEELDGRSDLFAVGVVLFELLTGVHPFDANTDFALQVNIMTGKRTPLKELLPGASAQVCTLLDMLLATSRDQRPAGAAEALELMPPLESQFALQRKLEGLVKQRLGGKGSAATTGSAPRPQTGPAAQPAAPSGTSDTALAAVPARGTTLGTPKRSLVPIILAVMVALLMLGGLGFALLRREEQRASNAPDPYAPPAIPQVPAHQEHVGSEPTANSAHEQGATTVAPAQLPALPSGADTHEAHHHAHKAQRNHEEPAAQATVPAAPPEESNQEVPVLAAPPPTTPPNAAPVAGEKTPTQPRGAYVTPTGRIVLPAPPLNSGQ